MFVTGTNFSGATSVTLGGAAVGFSPINDTSLSFVTPSHPAATLDVAVTTPLGTSPNTLADNFTYLPAISTISPTFGSTSGGTVVSITGTGLLGTTVVNFGATATTVTVVDDSHALSPAPFALAAGAVHVVALTPGGATAATFADLFTYVAGPTVSSVSPTLGPVAGGTHLTVTGAGFTGATTVDFGSAIAIPVVVTDTLINVTSPPNPAGAVDVRVVTPAGTSPISASAGTFTYVAAPVVTSVVPASGPEAGGTAVTVTGTSLAGATTVKFGEQPAVPTFSDATHLTVISPAHTPGVVDVVVITPGGISPTTDVDHFLYVAAPSITGLSPTAGPEAGSTAVNITGAGFTGASSVTFGGVPALSFAVFDDTRLTVVSPPHSPGIVNVVITVGGAFNGNSRFNKFTYFGAPSVTGVSPSRGRLSGGNLVTVTGSGFTDATVVSFGGVPATPTPIDESSLVVAAPAHVAGTVDVAVTARGGTSSIVDADHYTYVEAPTVVFLAPSSGPAAGGVTVAITGTGFTGAAEVRFGATGAVPTVLDDSHLTVSTPPHSGGTVEVVVMAPGGPSPVTVATTFTYTGTALVSYSLSFSWSFVVWAGANGMSVSDALRGRESPNDPNTNDIFIRVVALYRWNSIAGVWQIYLTENENNPGLNEFSTMVTGTALWILMDAPGTMVWTVQLG